MLGRGTFSRMDKFLQRILKYLLLVVLLLFLVVIIIVILRFLQGFFTEYIKDLTT